MLSCLEENSKQFNPNCQNIFKDTLKQVRSKIISRRWSVGHVHSCASMSAYSVSVMKHGNWIAFSKLAACMKIWDDFILFVSEKLGVELLKHHQIFGCKF